jgi:hypothetical protein
MSSQKDRMSRLQFVILAVLLALAIATAIPEMGGSNIARVFRGECTFAGGGRFSGVRCLPHGQTPAMTTAGR